MKILVLENPEEHSPLYKEIKESIVNKGGKSLLAKN